MTEPQQPMSDPARQQAITRGIFDLPQPLLPPQDVIDKLKEEKEFLDDQFNQGRTQFLQKWSATLDLQHKQDKGGPEIALDLFRRLVWYLSKGQVYFYVDLDAFEQIASHGKWGLYLALTSAEAYKNGKVLSPDIYTALFKADKMIGIGAGGTFGLYGYTDKRTVTPFTQQLISKHQMPLFDLTTKLDVDKHNDKIAFEAFANEKGFKPVHIVIPKFMPLKGDTMTEEPVDDTYAFGEDTEYFPELKPTDHVHFNLSFTNQHIDEHFVTTVQALYVKNIIPGDGYKLIYDTTSVLAIGSGSLQGMIGRYKKCIAVKDLFEHRNQWYNEEDVDLIQSYIPQYDVEDLWNGSPNVKFFNELLTVETVHKYSDAEEDLGSRRHIHPKTVKSFITIKEHSNSGILGLKRGKQRKNGEIGIDTILATGESIIRHFIDSKDPVPALLDRHYQLFLPQAKNKNEGILKTDILEKTRIVTGFSSPISIASQVVNSIYEFWQPCMQHQHVNTWDDLPPVINLLEDHLAVDPSVHPASLPSNTWKRLVLDSNLKGFNPANGWAERWIARLRSNLKVGNCSVPFYSDNLTLVSVVENGDGSLDWDLKSIDGVKMESQHSTANRLKFNQVQLRGAFPRQSRVQEVFQGIIDQQQTSKWVLEDRLIEPMGMASGYAATSTQNTFKMSLFLLAWLQAILEQRKVWADQGEVADNTPLTELFENEFTAEVQRRQCVKIETEKQQKGILAAIAARGVIVTDLLGYDLHACDIYGIEVITPILREESLIKSLATMKQLNIAGREEPEDVKYGGIKQKAILEINRMAKCQSLMLSGCWIRGQRLYLYEICTSMFDRSKMFLRDHLHMLGDIDLMSVYLDMLKEQEFPYTPHDVTVGKITLITPLEVLKHLLTKETYEAVRHKVLNAASELDGMSVEDRFYWRLDVGDMELVPTHQIQDILPEMMQAYESYLTSNVGEKKMLKFRKNVDSVGEEKVIRRIIDHLNMLQVRNKILLVATSAGEYRRHVERVLINAENTLFAFQAAVYTDPSFARERQDMTTAVQLMRHKGVYQYKRTAEQSAGAKLFGNLLVEMAATVNPELRGPIIKAIGNIDVQVKDLSTFLSDFLRQLMIEARKCFYIQTFGVYFFEVNSREEGRHILMSEQFSEPAGPVIQGGANVADRIQKYLQGEERLQQLSKQFREATHLEQLDDTREESYIPRAISRLSNSRNPKRAKDQIQHQPPPIRVKVSSAQFYAEQMASTKTYLTRIASFLPDLNFMDQSVIKVGYVNKHFPLYGDKVLICDQMSGGDRKWTVTAIPMTRQFKHQILKQNIIQELDLDASDLNRPNVADAIAKWKMNLQDVQIVPLIYRTPLNAETTLKDQILETVRAVRLEGDNRVAMGRADLLFRSNKVDDNIRVERYEILKNVALMSQVRLPDILRTSRERIDDVASKYRQDTVHTQAYSPLEHKMSVLLRVACQEEQGMTYPRVVQQLANVVNERFSTANLNHRVETVMNYFESLGFKADPTELHPYYSRIKYAVYSAARRAQITIDGRNVDMDPNSLKKVQRYQTYLLFINYLAPFKQYLRDFGLNPPDDPVQLSEYIIDTVRHQEQNKLTLPHSVMRHMATMHVWLNQTNRFTGAEWYSEWRLQKIEKTGNLPVLLADGTPFHALVQSEDGLKYAIHPTTVQQFANHLIHNDDPMYGCLRVTASTITYQHYKSPHLLEKYLLEIKEMHVSKQYERILSIVKTCFSIHQDTFGLGFDQSMSLLNWFTVPMFNQFGSVDAVLDHFTNAGGFILAGLTRLTLDKLGPTPSCTKDPSCAAYMKARFKATKDSNYKPYWQSTDASADGAPMFAVNRDFDLEQYSIERMTALAGESSRIKLILAYEKEANTSRNAQIPRPEGFGPTRLPRRPVGEIE